MKEKEKKKVPQSPAGLGGSGGGGPGAFNGIPSTEKDEYERMFTPAILFPGTVLKDTALETGVASSSTGLSPLSANRETLASSSCVS